MKRIVGILSCCLTLLAPSYQALADTFILRDQELIESGPHRDEPELRGKRVWLGGENGILGSAKLIRKGSDEDEVILNEEFGPETVLGYDAKTEFLPVQAKPVFDSALKQSVGQRAKALQPDASVLEFLEVARTDMDGDNVEEIVVKVNTLRHKDDPYTGKRDAFEGVFVAAAQGDTYKIKGEAVAQANQENDVRTNMDVLAIGKNPKTGTWEILTKSESRQLGEGSFNMTVTVNGQTSSTSHSQSITRNILLEVYRAQSGALSPISELSHPSFSTCFGSSCQ